MKIINNTNRKINLNNVCFVEPLKCIDASIYYEDNKPYINWKGETKLSDGSIIKVHIPKMGLDIEEIEQNINTIDFWNSNSIKISKQVFIKNNMCSDEDVIIEFLEREMTKEQIEKELGYKIKIKE